MKSTTTLGEAKRIICFFFPRSYLSGCSNNSGAGSNRPELTELLSHTLMASIPCVQRFLSCIAFSVYKVVRVPCLSCSWFVYAPGRKQTTTTRQNQAPLLIFAHAHEPKCGLYKMFFLRIYFDLFARSLFFPFAFPSDMQFCFPVYGPSFAWNCGWLTFLERDKFNLQRVVGKQQNWQWIFPQHVNLEILVERSIFADFVS